MCSSLKLLILPIIISVAAAWLLPERCEQGNFRSKRSVRVDNSKTDHVPTLRTSIDEIAANQLRLLNETYKDYKYYGVPSRDIQLVLENDVYNYYKFFAPYKCEFYTHDPNLLASVYCDQNISCKLTETVSTIKSYTSSEGYSWGVKMTNKIGEIGGEASVGGTYSCAYTSSKTTTKTVECSASVGMKTLQLYLIQSDMKCQFGEFTFKSALRNNRKSATTYYPGPYYANLLSSYSKVFDYILQLIDLDTVPDQLLYKLKTDFPHYNPHTDLVSFELYDVGRVSVYYYDLYDFKPSYQKVIPFTGKDGNSVYQYACITSV